MNQFKSFISKRLIIRPTSNQDAELVYELMNSPKFIKYVADRNINSINDASNHIKVKMLPQLHLMGYSNYTLIKKSNGDKIGICGLYNRDGIDGIDIGFGILPHFERLGYAYESSSRLIKGVFEELELEEIKAIVNQDNIPSQKLIKKLGFKLQVKQFFRMKMMNYFCLKSKN